jgi:hypothetical protein
MPAIWWLTPEQFAARIRWIAIVGAALFVVGPAWLLAVATLFMFASLGGLLFAIPFVAIPASFLFYARACRRLRRRDRAARWELLAAVSLNWNWIVVFSYQLAAVLLAVALGRERAGDFYGTFVIGAAAVYHLLANAYVLVSGWLRVRWPDAVPAAAAPAPRGTA